MVKVVSLPFPPSHASSDRYSVSPSPPQIQVPSPTVEDDSHFLLLLSIVLVHVELK